MREDFGAVASFFYVTAIGSISGAAVSGVDSLLCFAFAGDFTDWRSPSATFMFQSSIFLTLYFALFGALYGAAIGAILAFPARLAFPVAVWNVRMRTLVSFMIGGGFFGSAVSALTQRGSDNGWGPFTIFEIHLGKIVLPYVGPQLIIVIFAAIGFFGVLARGHHSSAAIDATTN